MEKKAIIIGAGPAGLTAAYELLQRTEIVPIILEKSNCIGGISRTTNYKGNRMDMGPHRFFSKSDRVMDWWLKMMPLEEGSDKGFTINYQNKSREITPNVTDSSKLDRKDPDNAMLVIQRLTRIYFLRKFFAYPIQLSIDTLRTLGLIRTVRILFSFLWIKFFPRKPEKSLEDFIINKFGWQLYVLFFKDYTEKVWGVPCHEISAEWGAQRIKGVSLSKAISQALKSIRTSKKGKTDLSQKNTETSLIEQFLYPKYGPGSLWEEVARQIQELGGKIYLNQDVQKIEHSENSVTTIYTINSETNQIGNWEADYFFSTMPVQELIAGMGDPVPKEVKEIAAGLQYRDFINVGILLKQLSTHGKLRGEYEKLELKDNWIYVQERDVKVGRLMIYNNWGGGMIKDPNTTWIGMEYFCNKEDAFWAQDNETIQGMAILELEKMGLAKVDDVLDITVQRMEKTYPAYFGTYNQFGKIREFTDRLNNLFLVGRNGMHKYNNADHSMLTAMVAVDNICAGITSKDNIWAINTEQEYHEEKKQEGSQKEKIPEQQTVNNIKEPESSASFTFFLWQNKWNRAYLIFAGIALIIQFFIFKLLYPFANYFIDSYYYLDAAYLNSDVNMWPVAYSKFLRIFSAFTHSDTLLVAFQYFFMQSSALFFFSGLVYFFKPRKIITIIIYIFLLFNPLALYLSNYISADSIFAGLSFLWATQLLWIICRPRPRQIFSQAVLLMLLFTVRYNAIYYPLVAALAFILSRQRLWVKAAGIALGSVLVLFSIVYTSNKMYEETGTRQFTAFGGWQLANNALYMYEHVNPDKSHPVPVRFAKLESMVQQHFDTLSRVKLSHDDTLRSFFYLWSARGPLIQYMDREWKKDTTTSYFKRWAAEGPLYKDYAFWLIRKYPFSFAKNFLLPNAVKYAVPPVEFLGVYNMGTDSVSQIAKQWFNYKTVKIKHYYKDHNVTALQWHPVFSALANLFLVISVIGFILFKDAKKVEPGFSKVLVLVVTLWFLNMAFSIFASPIVLRYEVFPISLGFLFSLISIQNLDLNK